MICIHSVGFDAVLFDTQHGECGFEEARDGIAAARLAGKPSVVRLSIDGQAEGARMLDVGAGTFCCCGGGCGC